MVPQPAGKRWANASHTKHTFWVHGLVDAHVHLLGGGQTLSWVDLRHADSRAAVAEAVKAAVGQ